MRVIDSHLTSLGSFSPCLTLLVSLTSEAAYMGAAHRVQRRSSAPFTVGEFGKEQTRHGWRSIYLLLDFFFFFFFLSNWMCGMCACVNRQECVTRWNHESLQLWTVLEVEISGTLILLSEDDSRLESSVTVNLGTAHRDIPTRNTLMKNLYGV